MSSHWVIRIQKPQTKLVFAVALSGSVAAVACWLLRWVISRHSDPNRQKHTPLVNHKVPRFQNDRLLCGYDPSEISVSVKSQPLGEGLSFRALSGDGGSASSTVSIALDCGRIGLQTLDSVIEKLEECMSTIHKPIRHLGIRDQSTDMFVNELQNFLETSYLLRERYKRVFIQQAPSSATELPPLDSLSDTESFFSTTEEIDYSELDIQIMSNFHRPFYRSALKELSEGSVPCRTLRTDMMYCESNIEYLGKLVCIRRGFDYILSRTDQIDWMTRVGRSLASAILDCLGYETSEFDYAFMGLIEYIDKMCAPENQMQLIDELTSKGIQALNFYDIVFDRVLIDALENLGNPPSSILVLTRNTWLSNDFKRSALGSAVWTLLTAKRKLLKYPDGFFSSYYRVVETITPALAWGFLGSDENLNAFCECIREEMVTFVRSLFLFADTSSTSSQQRKNVEGLGGSVESITGSSVYLEANEDGEGNSYEEDEDDDHTITPEGEERECDAGPRDVTHFLETYNGMDLTSLETFAECIHCNMATLEKRLSSLIKDFAAHNNISNANALLQDLPKSQPPLPALSTNRI